MTEEVRVERIIADLARTTEEIISLDEFRRALTSRKKLVMKYGADVTAPDLHIGHAVNLWNYRRLQEEGHKVVFLIGDFTTSIGDPTGKNKTRPTIPQEEIETNAEKFIGQARMVLIDDPEVLEIRRNSEWLARLSAADLLKLMSLVTHDRLLARGMFRKRVDEGLPIYSHELVYPLLQGYDSVALQANLTIIGSDQLYNEQMGRTLQERWQQHPQVIITTKITPGLDGGEKQSKSLGNYVGLSHSARDKFGRIMSVPDSLIVPYFEVYTSRSDEYISQIAARLDEDPMKCKLELAVAIVERYHGRAASDEEKEWFISTFSTRESPADAPVVRLGVDQCTAYYIVRHCFPIEQKSNTIIRGLFCQGAVKIGGEKIVDCNHEVNLPPDGLVVQVGKRSWFRVQR